MNIFVASWFFPPSTSSEGIVTYKLLRNSKHQYDVFSSTSEQWGYRHDMKQAGEENLTCYRINTDDIDSWVEACIAKFEELYLVRKYQCVMTRSMPPESILVGLRIKEKHPEIKWIASFADPISNNPYELKAYIDDCATIVSSQKSELKEALQSPNPESLIIWEKRPEDGIRLLCKLRRWEDAAIRKADLIICPSLQQMYYMLGSRQWHTKYDVVPHSFDRTFYSSVSISQREKTVFSFIGYSDTLRSLAPFVSAVRYMKESGSRYLQKLEMRLIGNHPRFIYDMVLNACLEDIIKFEPSVDYYTSLRRMRESDWLLHVDAFFPQIDSGGSIFFAGKLADYMGADKPIFALTGKGSPADHIVTKMGGVSIPSRDPLVIAGKLEEILSGCMEYHLDTEYMEQYSAPVVAAAFDARVEKLCGEPWAPRNLAWPDISPVDGEKLVTICVPAYNVERTLERCLWTLVGHELASKIEILVIDDGSLDHTAEIAGRLAERYPGVIRLIQKENGGHGSTINRAIREGAGRYFMVVDGDDWVDSRQLAALLAQIRDGQIDTDIISSNYHEIDLETGSSTPWQQQAEVEYFKAFPFELLDVEHVYFTLASTLIKLSVLRQIQEPLQEHTFYVDVEYILFPVPYIKDATFVDYYIYKYCRGNTEQSVYIPTMVKRYDHHERVMKRVLNYKQEHAMSSAQRMYYDAILRRLLYTHYSLITVYDLDKARGFMRGRRFDEFLCEQDPRLAKWIGKQMPVIRVARHYHFEYNKMCHSMEMHMLAFRQSLEIKTNRLKGILKNKVFMKVVYNRFTIRVGKLYFFENGRGKKIKEKLRKFCNFC